jgi:hypothetical protein
MREREGSRMWRWVILAASSWNDGHGCMQSHGPATLSSLHFLSLVMYYKATHMCKRSRSEAHEKREKEMLEKEKEREERNG